MLIDKITELLPSLTKKQAILGRYLCENMYGAALMNAPMIAREAGVSEATLTRFVYALGYEGFPEFLRDLRRCTLEAKNDNPFRQEVYRRKDRPVYKRVFELEKELLEETMNLLDTEMFELCVDRLAAADRIMLVGGPTIHTWQNTSQTLCRFSITTQKPLVRRIFPFSAPWMP